MKILILGNSVLDKIYSDNNQKFYAGGIYHSILKFIELKTENDFLSICTNMDSNCYPYFKELYEKCNNKYLNFIDEIPIVTISETSGQYRDEVYSKKPQKLKIDKIDFTYYDGILINMITGNEIIWQDLEKIKNQTSAIIYLDVHTLSRFSENEGLRKFRLIAQFDKWAKYTDIIQVNEFEFYTLFNIKDELFVAKLLLSLGVKALIITKAENGAIVYFMDNKEINFYLKTAEHIKNAYTIGCGDYFGAAFFYNYLIQKNPILSLNFAMNEVEKMLKRKLL